ncbi:CapA family protein [Phaeodactylibacter sp.]|uniref:CapA family protein n=1 Tax=Phaeodactylibacter sp. TaxID=1940289 RepID=UPI0025D380AF|nr:CapA family protein [Phaeodactylibacter sp.]MCI4647569.1 CapA family protein [Phaeodactylibacter sp.]MCI5090804.1 CapA family protein [Phaeodactylibacter sp.]
MAELKVLVTGDFCPVHRLANISAGDEQLLGNFRKFIDDADLAITNLECPITGHNAPIAKTGPALKGHASSLDFLLASGFHLVTLANNHIMDYGEQGLQDTLSYLKDKHIEYVGAGMNAEEASDIYYKTFGKHKLAIINVAENEWSTTHDQSPGANPIDPLHVYRQIETAKKQATHILLITHGGHEMYELPSPRMQTWFRTFIDMGADAVVNHHTHCVSGYEVYQGKPIFYSTGNFLFDVPIHRNSIWNTGMAVTLNFSQDKVGFEQTYFRQCDVDPILEVLPSNTLAAKVDSLNQVIAHPEQLNARFQRYCQSKERMYNAYLEPHRNKYLGALQSRGLLPSFWHKRKRLLLENLVRCEAHKDVVQFILSHENCHTQQ